MVVGEADCVAGEVAATWGAGAEVDYCYGQRGKGGGGTFVGDGFIVVDCVFAGTWGADAHEMAVCDGHFGAGVAC